MKTIDTVTVRLIDRHLNEMSLAIEEIYKALIRFYIDETGLAPFPEVFNIVCFYNRDYDVLLRIEITSSRDMSGAEQYVLNEVIAKSKTFLAERKAVSKIKNQKITTLKEWSEEVDGYLFENHPVMDSINEIKFSPFRVVKVPVSAKYVPAENSQIRVVEYDRD